MIKIKKNQKIRKSKDLKGFARVGKDIVQFPSKLLNPVRGFLLKRLELLEKRKKEILEEDPFKDTSRIIDNASPDSDAAEQFGHARIAALREQIDKRIIQTRKALSRLKVGKYGICEDCGKMIDTDRLMAYPETTICASCQKKREK